MVLIENVSCFMFQTFHKRFGYQNTLLEIEKKVISVYII